MKPLKLNIITLVTVSVRELGESRYYYYKLRAPIFLKSLQNTLLQRKDRFPNIQQRTTLHDVLDKSAYLTNVYRDQAFQVL